MKKERLDRLNKERSELFERTTRLRSFVNSEDIGEVTPEQAQLLKIQLGAMTTYLLCLHSRILDFETSDRIKRNFNAVAKQYVERFLVKQGYEENGIPFDYDWIADDVGGVISVSDLFINFNDIRLDMDSDIPSGVYIEYYDSVIENGSNMNYRTYLMMKGLLKM